MVKPAREKDGKKPSLQKRLFQNDAVRAFGILGLSSAASDAIRGYGEGGSKKLQAEIPLYLRRTKVDEATGTRVPKSPEELRKFRLLKERAWHVKKEDALPVLQNMYDVKDLNAAREFSEGGLYANPDFRYFTVPRSAVRDTSNPSIRKDFVEVVDAFQNKQKSLGRIISEMDKEDLKYLPRLESAVEAKELQTPEAKKRFKELTERVESFVAKNKLREDGLRINLHERRSPVGTGYNPVTNTVNLNRNNPYQALQQVAKASDLRGNVWKSLLRSAPLVASGVAVPFAMRNADAVKEKNPDGLDSKVLSFIKDHPVATGLTGYGASVLYPEAKASLKALRHIAEESGKGAAREALKKYYAPHLAKYTLGALPLGLGILGVRKVFDKSQEKKASLDDLIAKIDPKLLPPYYRNFSPWPRPETLPKNIQRKAFWKGFAGAAVPTFMTLAYLHGTKGGKAIREKDRGKQPDDFRKDPFITSAAIAGLTGYLSGSLTKSLELKRNVL